MVGSIFIIAFLTAIRISVAEETQAPLASIPRLDSFQSGTYKFEWPIHRVAIIGAGVSGLVAYREFSQAGYDVHIFERDNCPGGNWHYTEETHPNAPIPNVDISIADFTPSLPPKDAKLPYVEEYQNNQIGEGLWKIHRFPKPIWASLTSNHPAPIQQITEFPWPKGAPLELPHKKLQNYLRAFASWHGINTNDDNPRISYNTRVELVEKRYAEDGSRRGWTLTAKELLQTSPNTTRATWTTQYFDAVVVATGRFNAPNIPNIEGLEEWAKRFPDRISHSRQYRRPEAFSNQTVLIVGAATSGQEICRDIIHHVHKPSTSSVPRNDLGELLSRLPLNATVVPQIKRFLPIGSQFKEGQIELVDGNIISGLDHIIFATGYRYTFPFLPQYHNSSIGINDTVPRGTPQPIITDGTHLRSLYLDTFYIDDPTLGFLNMNFGPQSFTYGEFLSLAMVKVWAGKADLPNTTELWRQYYEMVKHRGGYGKRLLHLDADQLKASLRFYLGWLNAAAVKYGGRQIDATPDTSELAAIWKKVRYLATDSTQDKTLLVNGGTESWVQDIVFNDDW